jgi:hypothetical protein
MRSHRRSDHNQISYRESSVEESNRDSDFVSSEEEVAQPSSSRRRIALPTRQPNPTTGRRHSTRESARQRSSLRDPSTDEDFSSEDESEQEFNDELVALEPPPKRRRTARPIATRTRQANNARQSQVRTRRPQKKPGALAAKTSKSKNSSSKKRILMETDGVSPPWATLPYQVSLSIFEFAYAKEIQDSGLGNASSWLSRAARTCVAFSEPALTVLHRKPELWHSRRIVNFADHMAQPPEMTYINYRSKVKVVAIDERLMPTGFAFVDFLRTLPQLAYLDIFSSKDSSLRGHPAIERERYWKYPTELVPFLASNAIPLISWHWNWKMMDITADSLPTSNIMSCSVLRNLREVKLTNFPLLVTSITGENHALASAQVEDEILISGVDEHGKKRFL